MRVPEEPRQDQDVIAAAAAASLVQPALEDAGGHGVTQVMQAGRTPVKWDARAQLPERRPHDAGP